MPIFLKLLLILLAIFNVFFLPGYGLVRRAFKTTDAVELAVLSLGIGFFGGSLLYFTTGALLHLWITPALVLITANIVNLLHLPVFIRDGASLLKWGNLNPPLCPRPRGQAAKLLLLSLIAVFFLLARFDAHEFHLTCINYPVAYVTGIRMGDGTESNPMQNDILSLDMEEREGNVAIMAATIGLFNCLGYRLFFGLENLILFLFAFLLGEAFIKSFRAGLLLSLLFLFNPSLASLTELDQNVNTLAASIIMFYLLLREEPKFFWAGFFFAIAFGCRHIVLPGIVGLIYYALYSHRPFYNLGRIALGFSLPSLLWSAHHLLAFGSLFYEETFRHFTKMFPHNFLGIRFDFPAILQWPLVTHLLRSPYNGLPQVFLLPFSILKSSGTILCAFFLAGAAWLFAKRRKDFLLLFLWTFPVSAVLLSMGHTPEVDKLRLAINLFGFFIVCAWAGFLCVVRSSKRKFLCAVVAVVAIALTLGVRAMEGARFPVDPREYEAHPAIPLETDREYEIVRREFTRGSPLPDPFSNMLWPLFSILQPDKILREIGNSRCEDQTESITQKLAKYIEPALYHKTFEPDISWKPPDRSSLKRKETVFFRVDLSSMPTRVPSLIQIAQSAPESRWDVSNLDDQIYLKNKKLNFYEQATDFLLLRESMDGQEMVLLLIIFRKPGFYPDLPSHLESEEIYIEMNSDARLTVIHALHSNPLIAFLWDVEFDPKRPLQPVRLNLSKI